MPKYYFVPDTHKDGRDYVSKIEAYAQDAFDLSSKSNNQLKTNDSYALEHVASVEIATRRYDSR